MLCLPRDMILNGVVNHESALCFALEAVNLVGELEKIGCLQTEILNLSQVDDR